MKRHLIVALVFTCLGGTSQAATAALGTAPVFGPVGVEAHGSGPGSIDWFDGPPPTAATQPWTVSAWVRPTEAISGPTLVAGFGDGIDYIGSQRFLAADASGWFFWIGNKPSKSETPGASDRVSPPSGSAPVLLDQWQYLAATFDGTTLNFFVNGKLAATDKVALTEAAMQPLIAPPPAWKTGGCFSGRVAFFYIESRALTPAEIGSAMQATPAFLDQVSFRRTPDGPTPTNRWAEFRGTRNLPPQPPDTFPQPVPPVTPTRTPKLSPEPMPALAPDGQLILDRGWELADAATVSAGPGAISRPGFDTRAWYDATVPGTVLTSLVQQGVYPDPLHGLNNLLIPDLAKKTWWYRVQFATPKQWKDRSVHLTFNGINYHAQAWLNGRALGEISGAFIRGEFDATPALAATGSNVLAVRIWPQPHFWIGSEESVKEGAGSNGAEGSLDGPTFFCSEGWDWIPTIRDRNTGIWQDVVLRATGPVALGDPRVVTTLPKSPDVSVADVTVQAEARNLTADPQRLTLEGSLGDVKFSLPALLAPGETKMLTADPTNVPGLAIANPQLWWPNGYGEPTLHDLTLRLLDGGGQESDRLTQRIGLRQMSYEYLPASEATKKKTPLVIKVNGERIFILGGNWGMDDALKRSARTRLEPYFRLHRDAHVTMVRNWMGQQTEESFYALADKYGILVWNDFWLSTYSDSAPPADAERWLANSADAIKRYRDHASIAVWCGRNEGNPPDWLGQTLEAQLRDLDGTRTYEPSSNSGPHLMGSGPWTYMDPLWYFKEHAQGFTTELGINSVPTAGALKAMLDPSQYWPANDAWAYHDFHSATHGSVRPYVATMEKCYGKATGLEDFVRRIQMVNYTHHRTMLEAWNARMWNPTTGLLLWMTHPAWPSTVWQIYSSDYDTHASYYGFQKAAEMRHVQWNLDTDEVAVVNRLAAPLPDTTVILRFHGLDGQELEKRTVSVSAPGHSTSVATKIAWPFDPRSPVVFLKMEWRDNRGQLLSDNFYWRGEKPEDLLALNQLPPVKLETSTQIEHQAGEVRTTVSLTNRMPVVALMTHLILRNGSTGQRILPAYYSDNYVSLLPEEQRTIVITCPEEEGAPNMQVGLEGWNIVPGVVKFDSAAVSGIRPGEAAPHGFEP
jgi:hypothetical protein